MKILYEFYECDQNTNVDMRVGLNIETCQYIKTLNF